MLLVIQFVSGQFEQLMQFLRHFYAFFLNDSSWTDQTSISKMKKILALLEERQAGIITYKKELQSSTSAGAGAYCYFSVSLV